MREAAGMCAILPEDIRHLCPGWRTSPPGIGSIPDGGWTDGRRDMKKRMALSGECHA